MSDEIPSPYGAFEMPQSTINETIPPPPRPFIVATDLSHYVVRETDTGKSLTKRCTFDEADHACNLLNYGWRACQKQATDEMSRQQEVEARERALFLKQIGELEAMVYHTPPGQMEYAPEGWTWQQQCNSERGRYAELESECIDQSGRVAHLQRVVKLLREEVNCSRVNLIREEHPNGGTVAPFYSLNTHGTQADDCNYADARAAVDDAKALTDPVLP